MHASDTAVISDPAIAAKEVKGHGPERLAEVLRIYTGHVTLLVAHIMGADDKPATVTTNTWHSVCRALKPRECAFLDAPSGALAEERHSTMWASGVLVAEVQALVITDRLPKEAREAIKGNTPLGAAVAAISEREPLGAVPYMGGVMSCGRLHRKDWDSILASASEQFMPWFCAAIPTL